MRYFPRFMSLKMYRSSSLPPRPPITVGNPLPRRHHGAKTTAPKEPYDLDFAVTLNVVSRSLATSSHIPTTTHILQVSSECLKAGSSYFRKALDPDDGVGIIDEEYEVAFLGEDSKSIVTKRLPMMSIEVPSLRPTIILFSVLHKRLAEIPGDVNSAELRSLAVLARRFGCVETLSPWVSSWVGNITFDPMYIEKGHGYEDWLFIGTVFKVPECLDPMSEIVSLLVNNALVPDKTQREILVLTPGGPSMVNISLIPGKIIDKILRQRERALEALLSLAKAAIESITLRCSANHRAEFDTKYTCQRLDCLDLSIGSLLRSVHDNGLQCLLEPRPKAPDIMTLSMLTQRVQGLHLRTSDAVSVPVGPVTLVRCEQPPHSLVCSLVMMFLRAKERALAGAWRSTTHGRRLVEDVLKGL